MRDEGKEKELNNAEAILNAITVDEAISTFRRIENWIIEILECSSADFLELNRQFKTYHRESKNILENVFKIIEVLTDEQLVISFQKLKLIVEGFNRLSQEFTSRIETFEIDLKKSINKIDSLRISYQNLRQIIVSSPLLMIDSNDQKGSSETRWGAGEIEILKELFQKAEGILNQFVVTAQSNSHFLSDVKKDNYIHLQRLNDNIEVGFELFYRKHQEVNQFSVALKEQAENNTAYISTIITNLQYHDIIRQKIEHIQRTHQDILTELGKFASGDPDETFLHNKAKTYIKIRDISGLQAAQLIHANNQYQTAIREIFRGLEQIGNNMIAINSMCENLVGKSGQSKKYYLENIVENLHEALEYNQKLMHLTQKLNEQTHALHSLINSLVGVNDEIIQVTQKYFASLGEKLTQTNENSTATNLKNLNKECTLNQQQVLVQSNELLNKIKVLYQLISEFTHEGNLLTSFEHMSKTIPDLINLLQKSIKDVDEFLFLNSIISQKISDEIQKVFFEVKYYTLFENNCEKIINELNILNVRLNYGYELSAKERAENLKLLKSRYTMASEHLIHDQLSQMDNISDVITNNSEKIIEIANQKSDSDDENLELF